MPNSRWGTRAAGMALAVLSIVTLAPRLEAVTANNVSGWWMLRGLLAGALPEEAQVEAARQALYQALDAGLPASVFGERMLSLELARWREVGEGLAAASETETGYRAHTYAEWTRVNYRRLIVEPRLLEQGAWLPAAKAAAELELWSLAAYLFSRAASEAPLSAAAPCVGYARVLIELRQPAMAYAQARCALAAQPDSAAAQWHLIQALAQQARWMEAGTLLNTLARSAPDVLNTPEAAALAASVAAWQPQALAVSPAVAQAWERQAGNLVENGSFEAGVAGWAMWPEPGSQTLPDPERAYAGLQSMRATFDGTQDVNYYQIVQVVPVMARAAYRLTAQLWAEDFTGNLGLEVRHGEWFAGNTEQVTGTTGAWQPVGLSFEVPAGVHEIGITLRRYGGGGLLAGTVWVDDVHLAAEAP